LALSSLKIFLRRKFLHFRHHRVNLCKLANSFFLEVLRLIISLPLRLVSQRNSKPKNSKNLESFSNRLNFIILVLSWDRERPNFSNLLISALYNFSASFLKRKAQIKSSAYLLSLCTLHLMVTHFNATLGIGGWL